MEGSTDNTKSSIRMQEDRTEVPDIHKNIVKGNLIYFLYFQPLYKVLYKVL